MKRLHLLKTLVDVFFFFAVISAAAMVIFIPIQFMNSESIPIEIKGQKITTFDLATKMLMVFAMLSGLCFVYAIYLFRKTILHFSKKEIFHPNVITYLNKTGLFIIASTLLINVPLFFFNMSKKQEFAFEIGAGGFDSLLLSISLGLFFMVLAEVFKMSGKLKAENELTV